ncbi:hypothetical protein [Vibrio parahaemolyticus]|uniref:hypothetical protein n=1 Tax=Vibrio parahaemolyticus TaxID=670 RepID=UPI0011235A7F|nr:hypothetical protein [Vibrio parahaemolyticus]TOI55139.1 hypothetical protein CGI58_06085 [Vibrio parahaemolyticus]
MEITIDLQAVADFFNDYIIRAFHVSDDCVSISEDHVYSYELDEHTLSFSLSEIEEAASELLGYNAGEGTEISSPTHYEVAVRNASRYPLLGMRRGELEDKEDTVNKLNYSVGPMSLTYFLSLLQKLSEHGDPILLFRRATRGIINSRARRVREEFANYGSAIEAVMKMFNMFNSLKIHSQSSRSYNDFERFSDAFLFEISYNLDAAIMPQKHIEELARIGSAVRERRSSYEDIDVPRRHYIKDLVHHYQMGVSTDDPFLEFISFYHVAEHFFKSVYEDEVVNQIKSKLTHPNFSYKRKKDIKSLISNVKKLSRSKEDGIGVSEIDALEYTIKKFVDLGELKSKLKSYDDDIYEYYINNEVPFSAGPRVNFENQDEHKVVKDLVQRIYFTRNAIVHSKDGEKGKYLPFSHEKQLVKEVPLLRFISEAIIISNSNVVGS